MTREDKVKQVLDEIIEKLPEEFNMVEIMNKVEERTPYVISLSIPIQIQNEHFFVFAYVSISDTSLLHSKNVSA